MTEEEKEANSETGSRSSPETAAMAESTTASEEPEVNGGSEEEDDDEEEEDESSSVSAGVGGGGGGGEEEDEESDSESSSLASSRKSSDFVPLNRLRHRIVDQHKQTKFAEDKIKRKIGQILRKSTNPNPEEISFLSSHPDLVSNYLNRKQKKDEIKNRKEELFDAPEVLHRKCLKLAEAIQKAKNLVVYTGAGISTAANIPDYRGPNGVWTKLDKGEEIGEFDLIESTPTLTHMALFSLFKRGKLKHIVSQNCDGLHMRSGIPRYMLSEVHGNMFIEICKECKPMRPFVRLFDVTEKTSKHRHTTRRKCYICGNSLYDTIVHFGERGSLKWPINWDGASKAADKADVILCLGSSLKVLRRYPWLWCMDRPKKQRPKLYIVNLQWTPKDSAATLKLNGKTDDVLQRVFDYLEYTFPEYCIDNDPLLSIATRLNPLEEHTTSRKSLTDLLIKKEAEEPNHVENDHTYSSAAASAVRSSKRSSVRNRSNGLVNKTKFIDFKTISWPRDALYCPYENRLEFLEDPENESDTYPCDCCNPAKRRKQRQKRKTYSSASSSSDDEDDDDDEDSEEETEEEESKNDIKVEIKEEIKKEDEDEDKIVPTPKIVSQNPGWFGKGRRKRTKC